jgi:CheY-like chemotaxis protein
MKPILLVEDNPDEQFLAVRALQKAKIANEIVVARDGQEAIDYVFGEGAHAGRDVSQLPAVVLLDLRLPKVDGQEVLKRIREDSRTALLPVVVLTSSKEDVDLVNSYKHGCNSYVQKPINFTSFSSAIEQLGMYWLLLNATPRSN